MEDIVIPMSRGNMEDIEQDGNQTEGMNSESTITEGDGNTPANSQVVYEREDRYALCDDSKEYFLKLTFIFRIVVDYSTLPDKYKELFDPDEVKRDGDRLQRQVNDLSNTIQRIQAPNMRVCLGFFHPLHHLLFLNRP